MDRVGRLHTSRYSEYLDRLLPVYERRDSDSARLLESAMPSQGFHEPCMHSPVPVASFLPTKYQAVYDGKPFNFFVAPIGRLRDSVPMLCDGRIRNSQRHRTNR